MQKIRIPTEVRIKGIPNGFEPGTIVRAKTAQVVSLEQLLADVETARVVYIGEVHNNSAHHDVQLKILKALVERHGGLLVGMEMFEASHQDVLDQWRQDTLDENSLLEGVDWENTWKFDYGLYRPIMDFIRTKSLNVVGLNVPGPIVEKVARKGLSSLADDERSQIARQIDTSHEAHRAYVRKAFEDHELDEIQEFEFFYQAQCVWDDSMAEAVSQALDKARMVVLSGNGHIAYNFGIPDRVYRRTRASFRTVMPVAVGTEVEADMADYIWVTPAQMPGKRRRFVGVRLKVIDGGKGVLIEGVIEESPAALAGIKPQDILLAIDGKPISGLVDVHKAVAESKQKSYLFEVKRQGEVLELVVEIRRANPEE